ncbi:DUF896 domain-containing protein [Fundicoccus culcitae]|uniref:UPF0291 protein NRE15_03640 n=1 Tax=Fundicoccus culcitae TaxID=2969821 RepID=A0ABY5P8A7_9LACT|nr:DUF896 domain-containing protein [Fundicoccus culcitae]UUX34754.1 DUF896 domain-containing protein [Fundicoccus culcitae]
MIAILPRINELAAKNREVGLTPEEIVERDELRQAYLQEIRGQVISTMTSVTVVNEAGEDITSSKLVIEKAKQYQRFPMFNVEDDEA